MIRSTGRIIGIAFLGVSGSFFAYGSNLSKPILENPLAFTSRGISPSKTSQGSLALNTAKKTNPKGLIKKKSLEWKYGGNKLWLEINLVKHLEDKQIKLINSGFTTYSYLEVFLVEKTDKNLLTKLLESRCTVQFDPWEEVYSVYHLDKKIEKKRIRKFEEYANLCLSLSLKNSGFVTKFAKYGAPLKAVLRVDQISGKMAKKIRRWLVNQQSQVMKGLFSHMLGDLQLSEKISIDLVVQPYVKIHNSNAIEVIVLYPNMRNPL